MRHPLVSAILLSLTVGGAFPGVTLLAAETAESPPAISVGKGGFVFRSADGDFQLRIRGYFQADARFFASDRDAPATDTFVLRRARPIFEATLYKIFDVRLMPDFGEGKSVIQDGYLEARFAPFARLRAGKYKAPFGMERLQSATDILFVERALPTNLAPNRDIGLQLSGEVRKGALAYAAGVFNGVSDGGSADGDISDAKEGAARVFAQPFKSSARPALAGLGLGLAATYGANRGTPGATGLSGPRTAGQRTFFSYRSDGATAAATAVADGRRARLSPQLRYSADRFGLQAEYVRSSQEVRLDGAVKTLTSEAWQASASFMLTRDKASWNGVDPARPFEPSSGAWGAFELAVRAGRLAVDREAFPVFADADSSARAAAERAVGVNWHLNRAVKLMLDYSWTRFDGGDPAGDRASERVLMSRFQISF